MLANGVQMGEKPPKDWPYLQWRFTRFFGKVETLTIFGYFRFAFLIFVYQLALVYHFEHGLPLCVGLKAFLKPA